VIEIRQQNVVSTAIVHPRPIQGHFPDGLALFLLGRAFIFGCKSAAQSKPANHS
jgi:hypothetical protein